MADIPTLLISTKLADDAFTAKGVPNADRAKQLGLIASFLSPSGGGGYGSSVLPAVLVQQTAQREAAAAAAAAAAQTPPPVVSPPAATQPPSPAPVSRDEFEALKVRVDNLERLFVLYPSVKGKTIKEARAALKEFNPLVLDVVLRNRTLDEEKDTVAFQSPEPKEGLKLLHGSIVVIATEGPHPIENP